MASAEAALGRSGCCFKATTGNNAGIRTDSTSLGSQGATPTTTVRFWHHAELIRAEYEASGATAQTVDAVVGDIHGEGQATGSTPGLSWITSFQAIVALEAIAVSDGAITEGEHPLLEHFSVLRCQYG